MGVLFLSLFGGVLEIKMGVLFLFFKKDKRQEIKMGVPFFSFLFWR